MKMRHTVSLAILGTLLGTSILPAQEDEYRRHHVSQAEHERAEREQTAKDHRHHTGAKVVGGTAVGGAVIGGLAGGPKGALIGGAAGAGAGAVANKVRKDHAVKERERREEYPR